jgi:hypothetical protein
MDSMHSTFAQNIVFIRESIEEIIKPDEIGSYSDDAKRLYRSRKFEWIKLLVEQIQDPKQVVTNTNRCEVIIFLTINELSLVRTLQKFNRYEFFSWEKNMIKNLYGIVKKKDTTIENVATRVIDILKVDTTYAKEPKMLKDLLGKLIGSCQKMGFSEAEHAFKTAADQVSTA